MDYEIIPAYDHPETVKELFSEYFDMIKAGDDNFDRYLVMQNADEEISHLEGKYGLPDGRIYLLMAEGKATGCIALRRIDSQSAELKRMYIRPAYRRNGFGEILVKKIIADAGEIGYNTILLDTLPFLDGAVRLYKRCGFTETEPYNDSPMRGSIYMRLDLI